MTTTAPEQPGGGSSENMRWIRADGTPGLVLTALLLVVGTAAAVGAVWLSGQRTLEVPAELPTTQLFPLERGRPDRPGYPVGLHPSSNFDLPMR